MFLVLLQWGFYFGYKHDTTVVLDALDADIWIIPKGQATFDGFTSIDDLAYWKAKDVPDVQKAARVVWGFAPFRDPVKGTAERAQILGVEFESGIGIKLAAGHADLVSLLRPDGHILVGRKSQRQLGVYAKYVDGVEIFGRRAVVVGFVEDVHLFTTLGFVMTGLDNARAFLGLAPSQVTYVVCKCQPGADVRSVVRELQERIPEDDVLTTQEFRAYLQELGNADGSRSAAALPLDSRRTGRIHDGNPHVLYLDDQQTSALRFAEGHRRGKRRTCIHPAVSSDGRLLAGIRHRGSLPVAGARRAAQRRSQS